MNNSMTAGADLNRNLFLKGRCNGNVPPEVDPNKAPLRSMINISESIFAGHIKRTSIFRLASGYIWQKML